MFYLGHIYSRFYYPQIPKFLPDYSDYFAVACIRTEIGLNRKFKISFTYEQNSAKLPNCLLPIIIWFSGS